MVEQGNRSVAQRAGEHYFLQQAKVLARDPTNRLAGMRVRELGFDPGQVSALLRGTSSMLKDGDFNDLVSLAGKRISDYTQFRSTPLARGLWAQAPQGRMAFQFKQFSIGQAEFMTRELFAAKRGDPARTMRALAAVTIAFPAVGATMAKVREHLMGQALTSDVMNTALEDPTVLNVVGAGMATLGTLGIISDLTATAVVGNKFALTSFFIPPTIATMLNAIDVGASAGKALVNQDLEDVERGVRTASREFGGAGAALVHRFLREAEPGRQDDEED